MSETTTSWDQASPLALVSGSEVIELQAKLDEVASKSAAKIIELETQVRELQGAQYGKIDRRVAKDAIIELTAELTGESDIPDSLDAEQLQSVNNALDSIGADTFKKTWRVQVSPSLEPTDTVEIEVEAASWDEAVEQVESGDYDDDILSELNISNGSVQISDYSCDEA